MSKGYKDGRKSVKLFISLSIPAVPVPLLSLVLLESMNSTSTDMILLFTTNNLNRDAGSETGIYQSLGGTVCFILFHQASITQDS